MDMITGKVLIDMGYKPNKLFKTAIEYANANNLVGDSLRAYMDSIQPIHIEPHSEPLGFHKNIRPETEDEREVVRYYYELAGRLV